MKLHRILAFLLVMILFSATAASALTMTTAYDAFYIIPDSDVRKLTQDELWAYTRETLRYIRNELLARHGYAFEMEKFYTYFNAKPWYAAGDYGMKGNELSKTEWDNIATVKAVESAMDRKKTQNAGGIDIRDIIAYQNLCGGYGNTLSYGSARGAGSGQTVAEKDPHYDKHDPALRPSPATPIPNYIYNREYIIPDSNSRALSVNELWAYSRETLRYIRNELLARHGYTFGDNKFGRYFKTKSWYKSGGFENAVLSSLEWDNIDLVKQVERTMDALGTQNASQLDIAVIQQNQSSGHTPGI